MFEGLVPTLQHSADRFHDKLERIENLLGRVAEGIAAQVNRNTWVRKTVSSAKEVTAEIRNDTGYGWLVRYVSSTVETEWFLDTKADTGFLRNVKKDEGDNVHWYVPPGSILFIEFPAEAGTVGAHIEQFVTPASPAATGSGGEHVDTPRIDEPPSGHPLPIGMVSNEQN